MKILLITRYFPPLEGVATHRLFAWAKYWSRMGHEVTICTTLKGERSQPIEGLRILEVPYFDPLTFCGADKLKQASSSGPRSRLSSLLLGWYRRRLNERLPGRTDHWITQAKKVLRQEEEFDLIVSSYGPPSAHMIGLWAKQHFQCLWFADFRDLWVKNHNYIGIWPLTWLEKVLERKVARHADLAITVSQGLKKILQSQYEDLDVRVVPNGFDPENYQGLQARKSAKFSLVYTGTLYESHHRLEPLFQALRNLLDHDPDFAMRFELLFYGSATRYLHNMIEKYHLGSLVIHKGEVTHKEALQAQCDAEALLLLDFAHHYEGLMSGKVYEYMYAGQPILGLGVAPGSELGQLIVNAKCGILCDNREKDIAKTLTALMKGHYLHQGDRIFIEQFSRKNQAEVITSWALKCSQRTISSSQ